MSHQDYRRTSYETWEAMAPGWERWRAELEDALTPVRDRLITDLAPQPGNTVLELAAGPGDTGFAAAALVGEGGRLISTDFSPEMVEVARRRGAELGLENVDYRAMDAERIDLDVASVDGVLCRSGYMLIGSCRSSLRDAPRAAPWWSAGDVCWGAPERNPWASIGGGYSSSAAWSRSRSPVRQEPSAWRARSARVRYSATPASPTCAPPRFGALHLHRPRGIRAVGDGPRRFVRDGLRGLSEREREESGLSCEAFAPYATTKATSSAALPSRRSPADSVAGQLRNAGTTGKLGVDASTRIGFDVYTAIRNGATVSVRAFASLNVGGVARFYEINLNVGGSRRSSATGLPR